MFRCTWPQVPNWHFQLTCSFDQIIPMATNMQRVRLWILAMRLWQINVICSPVVGNNRAAKGFFCHFYRVHSQYSVMVNNCIACGPHRSLLFWKCFEDLAKFEEWDFSTTTWTSIWWHKADAQCRCVQISCAYCAIVAWWGWSWTNPLPQILGAFCPSHPLSPDIIALG